MTSSFSDSALSVDLDLIRKYSQPGPRYTSYPTAPHFSDSFGPDDLVRSLERGRDSGRPLSLYFHIPFCAKLCYFCGCTMIISRNLQTMREYVDHVIDEMRMLRRLAGPRPVKQVHWGGGTPTHLEPAEVGRLASATLDNFDVADDAEVSIEVDPRDTTEEHLDVLRAAGFNRLSMGVQDFHEPTQEAVNRIQPEALTRQLVTMARAKGYRSINLDFIYGLPHQTRSTFDETLDKLVDIRPDRIALFNYAHVPWMKKHQALISVDSLPSPEERLEILKLAIERLTGAGYVFIGMDHFALPEDSLSRALRSKTLYRNFQGYSTHADCDVIAHGMSGISQTEDAYAQNTKSIPDYYRGVAAGHPATERGYRLTGEDRLRRDVIMSLMCDFRLDFGAVERRYGIEFEEHFADALDQLEALEQDGLLTMGDGAIEITDAGRLLVRNIAMPFDAYLQVDAARRFSRTI